MKTSRTNVALFALWVAGAGCGDSTGTGGSGGGTTSTATQSVGAPSSSTGIVGGPCTTDNDCTDDGVYCNGTPSCVDGACVSTPVDCGATPAGCERIACDEASMACLPEPFDADGDGHGKVGCDGGTIPDDDCADDDAARYPGNWDGPAGDGHADACDDVDQDCTTTPDDATLADGTTCACAPGETRDCGSDVGSCEFGTETCSPQGAWGGCVGDVGPTAEICDGADNDCNGVDDDGNPGAGVPCATGVPGACSTGASTCQGGSIVCMQTVSAMPETCNGVDDNCNGTVDDAPGVGNACDGGDTDVCNEGVMVCSGSNLVCSDSTGNTSDSCDAGNDGDCNGTANQGCTCLNGQTRGCGDPACGSGIEACAGGNWTGSCGSDPQPQTQSQPNDGIFDDFGDFGHFGVNCSGPGGGSLLTTHWYSGPLPSSGNVGGTVRLQRISGGCYDDPNSPSFDIACYAALPGCAEPPEGWGAAAIGSFWLPQTDGAQLNLPSTGASGRTVCCDVWRPNNEWTPTFQGCCHRRAIFDWSASGCF